MRHPRLVGGLAALAALLILVAAPVALATDLPPANPKAAAIAQRYLGVPYVFGGASPSGFDASGLTMYVYAQLGVALPHGATNQQRLSKPIPLRRLRRGDLVFWGDASYARHVAIYAGNGRVIEARCAGSVVRRGTIKGAWIGGRLRPSGPHWCSMASLTRCSSSRYRSSAKPAMISGCS
jgi:cell wall-associated NlpC family hydrolase